MALIRTTKASLLDLELTRLHPEYCEGLYKTKLAKKEKEHLDKYLFSRLEPLLANRYYKGIGYLVILSPESNDSYRYFFSMSLIFYPKYHIRTYLDHHLKNFKDGKEKFITYVKHTIAPLVEANSPFNNTDRLDRIMKWVEEKETKISVRKDNAITSTDLPLIWIPNDKKHLRELSQRLFASKYISNSRAFELVFTNSRKTKWKGEAEYVIYLLYCLKKKRQFKVKHGKGYLKAAVKYFFGEDSEILAKENKIHHILSKVRIKQPETYANLREKVDSLLSDIFS